MYVVLVQKVLEVMLPCTEAPSPPTVSTLNERTSHLQASKQALPITNIAEQIMLASITDRLLPGDVKNNVRKQAPRELFECGWVSIGMTCYSPVLGLAVQDDLSHLRFPSRLLRGDWWFNNSAGVLRVCVKLWVCLGDVVAWSTEQRTAVLERGT